MTVLTLTARIEAVLLTLIQSGDMFTALDVSNLVKQDGEGFVRHRDCRQIINDLMQNEEVDGSDDYTVDDIVVTLPNGTRSHARCYHLIDDDPDDYVNRSQTALTPHDVSSASQSQSQQSSPIFQAVPSTPATPTPAPSVAPVGTQSLSTLAKRRTMTQNARASKKVKPRGYDGAIEIPAKVLETAGLDDNDVFVTYHPHSISISEANGAPGRIRSGRHGMRIAKSNLAKSGLDKESELTVVAFTGRIVIAVS